MPTDITQLKNLAWLTNKNTFVVIIVVVFQAKNEPCSMRCLLLLLIIGLNLIKILSLSALLSDVNGVRLLNKHLKVLRMGPV